MKTARRIGLVLFAALLCASLAFGANLWRSGYRLYIVHTGSMVPTLRPGDVVVDRPARGNYRTGEVITFRHSDLSTDVVTHRIIGVNSVGIQTKGDGNRTNDAWDIRADQVQGVATASIPALGYLLVYLQHPQGIGSILTTLVALMLLWQLFFPAGPPSAGRAARHKGDRLRSAKGEPSPVTTLPSLRLLESYHVAATAAPRQR